MRKYFIYSRRIAYALHDKGFRWLYVTPNTKFPQYNVYVFQDCPAFQTALAEVRQANLPTN